MISIVVNCDSRPGIDNFTTISGDPCKTSNLQGCRSWDFMTDGIRNTKNFFRGYDTELILMIDEVLPIPEPIIKELEQMRADGVIQQLHVKSYLKYQGQWADQMYLDGLRRANGDYVVHLDTDTFMLREDGDPVIDEWMGMLNRRECDFVCQPMTPNHEMWWASTRFFIARRDVLNVEEVSKYSDHQLLRYEKNLPPRSEDFFPECLEHTLGALHDGRVLYPSWRDGYLIFSWARYSTGLISRLAKLPYKEAEQVVREKWGVHGPGDVSATWRQVGLPGPRATTKFQVVTCANQNPVEPYYCFEQFKKSLRRYGIEPLILGWNEKFTGLSHKPKWLKETIESGRLTAENIIFCDAFDVLFAADPREIPLPETIIWNAEKSCFPDASLADKHPETASPFKYFNSGLSIGPIHKYWECLQEMKVDEVPEDFMREDGVWWHSNDQGDWMTQFISGKVPMKLDSTCQHFIAMNLVQPEEIDLSGDRIRVVEFNTTPTVFHFNGPGKTQGLLEPILAKLQL